MSTLITRTALLMCAAHMLSACGPSSLGVDYQGERLDVVDMHLHTGEWEGIGPSTQRILAELFPHPIGLNAETVGAKQIPKGSPLDPVS